MRSLEKEKAQVHKNQILNGEEFIEEKKTRRNKHKKSTFLLIFFNFIHRFNFNILLKFYFFIFL